MKYSIAGFCGRSTSLPAGKDCSCGKFDIWQMLCRSNDDSQLLLFQCPSQCRHKRSDKCYCGEEGFQVKSEWLLLNVALIFEKLRGPIWANAPGQPWY